MSTLINNGSHLVLINAALVKKLGLRIPSLKDPVSTIQSIVNLEYPPSFVLIKLLNTKMVQLAGLEKNVTLPR